MPAHDGAVVNLTVDFWSTMINTWFVMVLLVGGAWLVTRSLRAEPPFTPKQNVLEMVVELIEGQIEEVAAGDSRPYVPFVGTLFLFIVTSNLLGVLPSLDQAFSLPFSFYHPPTAVLETTAALAVVVFVAVPAFSIARRGLFHWLKTYVQPTWVMLPFNLIGDLSRTLSLAVRLFGNMMSGVVIGGVLLAIAPLVFPIIMDLFGLLTGVIQAYIFAILAMVYIGSATQVSEERLNSKRSK